MCAGPAHISSPRTANSNDARAYHALAERAMKSVFAKGWNPDVNDLPSPIDLHICAASVGT